MNFQPRQSLGEDQEKQEEAPRAGTPRPASPGPQTEVINQSNIQPSITDDENLHVNHRPGPNDDYRDDFDPTDDGDNHDDIDQGHNDGQEPGPNN